MKAFAVIVAGGKGLRMKAETRKQYLSLSGRPVLSHTLSVFDACPDIQGIILAVPECDADFCREVIVAPLNPQTPVHLVAGGRERQNSVYNGLRAVAGKADIVAIHDGVRPFVTPGQIAGTIRYAAETGACMLGIPAFDTLKKVDETGCIEKTLERGRVWLAQTPQTFRYDLILHAHEAAIREGYVGTDDASLVERLGQAVKVIPGSRFNLKITTPEDLQLAEAFEQFIVKLKRPGDKPDLLS